MLIPPPLPTDAPDDIPRILWSRMVADILRGQWADHLRERIRQQIGSVRWSAWKSIDLSANPLQAISSALAQLYSRWPTVTHEDPAAQPLIGPRGLLESSHLWPLMSRAQRDCIGLREVAIRCDVAEDGGLAWRLILPGLMTARPHRDYPDRPVAIREARCRMGTNGRLGWYWDEVDASGSGSYRVLTTDGIDVSAGHGILGGYDYTRKDGAPVLPYVLYHAARSGHLWDPWAIRELVEGTYQVGVYYTHLAHVMRSASWIQRYGIDVELQGAETIGEGSTVRSAIVTDPATVVMFRAAEDGRGQPQVGAFPAPSSPREIMETIGHYESRLLSMVPGLAGADQLRMTGDPRSGYAVSVSRDGQREAQRAFEPQFRAGDTELVEVAAILHNRWSESRGLPGLLPESGYRIEYAGIPASPQEREAQRAHLAALLADGLIDRVTAYRELHPGATEAEASTALDQIRERSGESAPAPDFGTAGARVGAIGAVVEAVRGGQYGSDAGRSLLVAVLGLPEDVAAVILP